MKHVIATISSILPVQRPAALRSFIQAKGFVHTAAILCHKDLAIDIGPQAIELLHACTNEAPDVVTAFQEAIFDLKGLQPLLDMCFHVDDYVRKLALQVVMVACRDNERNKAVLRERQALPMLSAYSSTLVNPVELRRLAFRAALEIGFMCDSAPFWHQMVGLLDARESDHLSDQQRAAAEHLAAETARRQQQEWFELRAAHETLQRTHQTSASRVTAQDAQIEHLTLTNSTLAVQVQSGQQEIAALHDHIRTLQQQVASLTDAQSRTEADKPTVEDLRDFMSSIAKFCNLPPPRR